MTPPQLEVTLNQIRRFEEALAAIVQGPPDERIDPRIRRAETEALQSLLDELRADVRKHQESACNGLNPEKPS